MKIYKHYCGYEIPMDELNKSTCGGCGRTIGRLELWDIISALVEMVKELRRSNGIITGGKNNTGGKCQKCKSTNTRIFETHVRGVYCFVCDDCGNLEKLVRVK